MKNEKRVYIGKHNDELVIFIELSSIIRTTVIFKLNKTATDLRVIEPNKLYYVTLIEHNVIEVVKVLRPLHFDIADDIDNYYDTIQSWAHNTVADQFLIENNTKIQQLVSSDLGPIADIKPYVLVDRSIRYQYKVKNIVPDDTLTSLIATRSSPDIWIDSRTYSVLNLIDTLIELDRLPILLVFNTSASISHHESLDLFQKALSLRNITDVGVYFRSDSKQKGRLFNQLIASSGYNKYLDETTTVAGVEGNNLPKFFLTSNWKPMSVISLNHALGHNKPSVYSNCCDLRITYSHNQPIIKRLTR